MIYPLRPRGQKKHARILVQKCCEQGLQGNALDSKQFIRQSDQATLSPAHCHVVQTHSYVNETVQMNRNDAFAELCRTDQEHILAEWNAAVFASYPLDTTGLLRTREDQFRNPGGHAIRLALEEIYMAVSGELSSERLMRSSLEMFVKLRAVQHFTTVQALGVIYLLKPLLRERILPACLQNGLIDAYLEAESRLDAAALLACDIYVASREQVFEERIGEIKRQHAQLIRWAQKKEIPGADTSSS